MDTQLIYLAGLIAFAVGLIGIILTMKENKMKLELAPVGIWHTKRGNVYDLREYFVDREGRLYSANLDTWELNPKKNRDLLICSDDSFDSGGYLTNSMRDKKRKKATIRRNKLKFNELSRNNGVVRVEGVKVTDRHIDVTNYSTYDLIKLSK